MERGLDILALDDKDMKKYLAWMRRRQGTYGLFTTGIMVCRPVESQTDG